MPAGFFLGVLVSLALLAAGACGGLLAARYLWPSSTRKQSEELQPVVTGLMQFTSTFSQDVSEYRSLIEAAAARAQALNALPQSDAAASDAGSSVLLSQIMEANEHLRKRLDEAEASLQDKSQELSSYMTEARTDALTGLPNRRALDDELNRRLASYRRQGTPLGVLLVDVDRFKSVNDRYGHLVGDQVLKAVADALRQAVRDCDLLARFGGEEFAVLVAGATREEFRNAAERVRKFVEQAQIESDGLHLQATISCGVAEASGGEEIASLLRRADEALYASKSAGRNCAHWHDGQRVVRITPLENNATVATTIADQRSSESFREVCSELRRKLLELTK